MLSYAATSGAYNGSFTAYIAGVRSSVGQIAGVGFERDPSNRIKKVIFYGTNGSAVLGGSWFKYMWNIWVDNNAIVNQERSAAEGRQVPDYLYSLTFFEY
jgi:hypothetical protein